MVGKKAVQPPLGMLTLASLFPKEWDLRLINLQYQQVSSRDWDEADLVLLSGMQVQHVQIVELIREAKKR
ncbi:MAG: cobalamin-binding protein, partial [Syntrophobacteraceae bacterium]